VCVADPPAGAVATITDTANVPTGQSPNLACVGEAPETPAGPEAATLFGAVARFGSGLKTYDIQVDVFDAATFHPEVCEAETTATKRAECYQSYGSPSGPGALPLGGGLSQPVDFAGALPATCADAVDKGIPDHSVCPLGYRCIEGDLGWECIEQYGVYEIADIPTNRMLVLRSRATTNLTKWHDSYTFSVYLYADQVVDGRAHYDATMVSQGQWLLTPNTVGLPDISKERGVLGGRVRDCHTADRDSWPVDDVSLDLANPAKKIVFFNNSEDDTVPLEDRVTTNILGRFAALDIAPGWNTLSGALRVGDAVLEPGAVRVYVFPNSLSLVTFPGLQPHWQQE
jgi:hypothetical protein